MIKLIATDMDDTLLDTAHKISPRTAEAVEKVIANGTRFCLSSGRMPEAMVRFAEELHVNCPMILFNGALIADPVKGETYFKQTIPCDRAREVAAKIENLGVYLQAYPGQGYFCAHRTKFTDGYEAHIKVRCAERGEPISKCLDTDVVKMLAIASETKIDELREILKNSFDDVAFEKSKPTYLEIFSQKVDKGRALKALSEMLGIKQEETMAFGDGQNDLAMIQFAGVGCAVENAVESVKAAANLHAPHHAQDGVAVILEEYLGKGLLGRS